MGVGRTLGRPTQKPHRYHRAAAPPSQPPRQSSKPKSKLVLRNRLPKAGMIYSFERTLLRRHRRDVALSAALRKDTHHLPPQVLDARFSRMFELGKELLPQQQRSGGPGVEEVRDSTDKPGPIAFIASLRQHEALAPWAQAVSEDLFISLFLVLGAARRNWYDTPRKPLDVAQHCELARTIDTFGRAETFEWTGVDVVAWIRGGGLMFHGNKMAGRNADDERRGQHEEMDEEEGSDQESDLDDGRLARSMSSLMVADAEEKMDQEVDGPFGRQMRSLTVEDTRKGTKDKGDTTIRKRQDARRQIDLTLDQVVESMRLLNIAFDEAELAESFAAMSWRRRRSQRGGGRDERGFCGGSASRNPLGKTRGGLKIHDVMKKSVFVRYSQRYSKPRQRTHYSVAALSPACLCHKPACSRPLRISDIRWRRSS